MIAALGPLELARRYGVPRCACPNGPVPGFAADARLALEGGRTVRARQRIALFGTLAGFEHAGKCLKEVCGWTLAPNTIGLVCKEEGAAVERWRAAAEGERFQAAAGQVEMLADGAFVNTVEKGWQEVKLAAVVKRESAPPAAAADWNQRLLPTPNAVSFRVAIAEADEFVADWRTWLATLGVLETVLLTCFADGAKWIWARWAALFPGHRGLLDFFHLVAKLAEVLRGVYPDRPGAVAAWLDSARLRLLTKGWAGLREWVDRLRTEEPAATAATEALLAYAAPHRKHLDYPGQLMAGRPIGSGLIEGGCKQVVGQRLKQTGARWRTASVRPMATLASARWADDWTRYWSAQLAA